MGRSDSIWFLNDALKDIENITLNYLPDGYTIKERALRGYTAYNGKVNRISFGFTCVGDMKYPASAKGLRYSIRFFLNSLGYKVLAIMIHRWSEESINYGYRYCTWCEVILTRTTPAEVEAANAIKSERKYKSFILPISPERSLFTPKEQTDDFLTSQWTDESEIEKQAEKDYYYSLL